eukprot:2519358-Rhodomonas_salina.1
MSGVWLLARVLGSRKRKQTMRNLTLLLSLLPPPFPLLHFALVSPRAAAAAAALLARHSCPPCSAL